MGVNKMPDSSRAVTRRTPWACLFAALFAMSITSCSPPETGAKKAAQPAAPADAKTAVPTATPSGAKGQQSWVANDQTPHVIGKFDPVSGTVVAEKGAGGILVFGPYVPLPPGQYKVTIVVRADAASKGASPGSVDINAFSPRTNNKVLATKKMEPVAGSQSLEMEFTAAGEGEHYEFRVYSSGETRLAYERTVLVPLR